MSKTIDEKVVEMRFDNSNFEKNAKQTMSTLDKFKEKLNFSGATKGIQSVQNNVNKFNTNSMTNSIEKVQASFSKMEVIGNTVLANLTNSAVNMGKNFAKSLLFSTKSEGWGEYELTMNAVKTLQNSTGKSVDEINEKLKTLDDYADETVYSTADMFNNIYKFTNAGIDLDVATTAMIGIANATALAGQGAQQASIAYYNLAQSIGMGYLTTIDYKSINLANIATKEFKKQMADAAVELGTIAQVGEDAYAVGEEVYSLQSLFSEGLKDQWATTDVMMKVFTDYGSKETAIGERAWIAAQSVNTFSDMMAALKAEAGTGWKETWQILFGSLDEAKAFWTTIYTVISNISHSLSEFRNNLLDNAFSRTFSNIIDNAQNAMQPIQQVTDAITDTTSAISKTLEDYNQVVNQIINGNWGNGQKRWDKLTEAGYDWAKAQNMVNERLGCSVRHAEQLGEAQEELVESTIELKDETGKIISKGEYFNKYIAKASDEELRLKGYTDDQIESFRELTKVSKKLGVSIDDLFEKGNQINGRWLIRDALKNIGDTITKVFGAIGQAFGEVFSSKISNAIFNAIAAFHRFSNAIKITDETASKIKDTFKGLFSLIDIALKVIITPVKLIVGLLGRLFGATHVVTGSILDVTAAIGRAITWFHDWVEESFSLSYIIESLSPIMEAFGKAIKSAMNFLGPKAVKAFESIKSGLIKLTPYISIAFDALKGIAGVIGKYIGKIVDAIKVLYDKVKYNENLAKIIDKLKTKIVDFFKSIPSLLSKAGDIGKNIFSGLLGGLLKGKDTIFNFLRSFADKMLNVVKEKLGIHSPSTEFFEIGKNVVLGLFNGIKDTVMIVYNLVQAIGNKLIELVKEIDMGTIITTLISGGILLSISKTAKVVYKFFDSLEGLMGSFSGLMGSASNVLNNFALVLKNKAFEMKSNSITKIIGAITKLVAAVVVLALLPQDKMWGAVGALTAILGALGLFLAVVKMLATIDFKGVTASPKQMIALAVSMIALGKAIKAMSKALQIISSIKDRLKSLIVMGAMMAILVGSVIVLGKIDTATLGNATKTLLAMTLLLYMIGKVFKIFDKLDYDAVLKGLAAMTYFGIFVAVLMVLAGKLGTFTTIDFGVSVLAIAGGLYLMAKAFKIISKLKVEDIDKAIDIITKLAGIMVAIAFLMKLISMFGSNASVFKPGGTILLIAAGIGILALSVGYLGKIDQEVLDKGIHAVEKLALVVAGLMWVTRLVGSEAKAMKTAAILIAASISIGILGIIASILGHVKTEALAKGTIAVMALGVIMSALMHFSKDTGKANLKVITRLVVAIGILAVSLALLSLIKTEKLLSAGFALSSAILSFAMLLKSTEKTANAKSLKTVLMMTVIVGLLAGIIFLLSKIPAENVVGSAAALAGLLLTLSGSLFIISKMPKTINVQAFVGLAALLLAMLGIVFILKQMDGIENIETKALVLAELMSVLTIVLIGVAAVGAIYAATGLIGMLGLVGMLALIGEMWVLIKVLGTMNGIDNIEQNAAVLVSLLTTLTDVLVKLAIIGPLAIFGLTAVGALLSVISVVTAFAAAIGGLNKLIPGLDDFISNGMNILIKLANGIGELLGAFIGGIAKGLTNDLPQVGKNLAKFAIGIMPFVTIMSMIPDGLTDKIKGLTGSILLLTAADFISSIANFLTGGNKLPELGKALTSFIVNALPFIAVASTIPPGSMEGIKSLCEAILYITGSNFIDNISNKIFGNENGIAKFGEQLKGLAGGLRTFAQEVKGFSEEDVTSVQNAADCIRALVEVSKEIPDSGGFLQKILGTSNIESFASQFPKLGEGLVNFSNAISQNPMNKELMDNALSIIKSVVEISKEIPDGGGFLQKIIGNSDLGNFAAQFPKLGEGVKGFSDAISGDNTINVDNINSAIQAINAISTLTSDNDISKKGSDLEEFASRLISFANKLNEFKGSMDLISEEAMSSTIDKVQKMLTLGNDISVADTSKFEAFGESLKMVGESGVDNFIYAISSDEAIGNGKKAVKDFIDGSIADINKMDGEIKSKFNQIGESAYNGLNYDESNGQFRYFTFRNLGKNFVEGFAAGIYDKAGTVKSAGHNIGLMALQAAQMAIDAHSPSRETYKLGTFFDLGFINGIKSLSNNVYNESSSLGDQARDGLSNAIERVSSIIDGGISDDIVISPILDLSDVESGANRIGSLLSGQNYSISSNLGAIASNVNYRNQNRVNNSDVLSAINKLGDNLGNVRGDTYNVNGITYDDGSNITQAVQTLIRAAKVERRT